MSKRHMALVTSLAVGVGLVVAPIVGTVTGQSAGASPVISAVGALANNAGTGLTTLAVSPQGIGDLLVLAVKADSTSVSASSISGGGVGTWTRAEGPYTGYAGHEFEIWEGAVTAIGSSTITVTFSASVTSISTEFAAQEFSGSGSGTVFSVDNGAGISNASSTTVTFPPRTPTGTGELYFSFASIPNTAAAGTTPGFTYVTTTDGDMAIYDTNVSSAVSPTASQSPAAVSGGAAVLIAASNSSPGPSVTQVSPSSGSTAGGTSVTITGTNFSGSVSVMFGSTASTNVTVHSTTSITAVSPAEPAWQTDVTVIAGGGTSATGAADKFTFAAAAPVATGTPHVMVIMMENESYTDLIGNSEAPTFNALAQDYGIATQSYAIGHPSEPNYLELISGSNYGVTADNTPQQDNISGSASTIVNQFEAAGISWRAYLENMPSAGYTGPDAGGDDGFGDMFYFQHHNPFVYFPAVTSLPDFDTNMVPLTSNFSSDLNSADPPSFVWVTPNTIDDMHDGPLQPDGDTVPTVGDAWLANMLGTIQASSWYAAGGQIVIQFDEGLDSDTTGVGTAGEGGGGHIATIVVSAALAAHPEQESTPVNTAGVLHSIEKVYGLSYLLDAANTGNGNMDSLMTLDPPTVAAVSPASGLTSGGTSVTVSGSNLNGVTAVDFGGVPATTFSVNSDSSITATSPPHSSGTVDLTLTGPGGASLTSAADQFTYFGVPTVTGVSPGAGPRTGGTRVTVTGTNLNGAGAVYFGSTPGTNLVVGGGETSLTVTAPAEAVGSVDVTVTGPAGTSAVNPADRFTFQSVGYWMVGSDGSVFSFGSAPYEGSLPGLGVHASDIVAVVPTSTGKGYWMIGSDGGVFAFGDAGFVGSLPGIHVHVHDIVGAVPTSTGKGYWMIGSDGGVFAFGDAGFVGSLPGIHVHVHDVVGAVPTSTGDGYWMVGDDGGVFAFGDAGFLGSLPGIRVHVHNVVGVVSTSDNQGYWMVGSDGGVFAFGDAGFVGSIPGLGIHVHNIVAFARQ
jgi:large repetitive protein